MRAIIPCCGYGTRMGCKPNESKELLIDSENDKPIIHWSLAVCRRYGLDPMILVREEKQDLIQWCKNYGITHHVMNPGKEWADTVFQSTSVWDEQNLLILPDTRFDHFVIPNMKNDLDLGCESSIAYHGVNDPDKWCVIKDYTLIEKPKGFTGPMKAMGMIAFTGTEGYDLFGSLQEIGTTGLDKSSFQYMRFFKDITRGK